MAAELPPADRKFDILQRFPADLMFNILLRLPVTSLRRCRCVSRRWREVIDSPNFVKSHLNNSLSNRPPSLLIVRTEFSENPTNIVNSYDVVELSSFRDGASPPPLVFKNLPVLGRSEIPCHVGQCNGLFCIPGRDGVMLWNPATGKQFQFGLPVEKNDLRNWGFGYDEDSDDFKVVAMSRVPEGSYLVWIYSLRSRSWKCIDFFPYIMVYTMQRGVFYSGALHWIVQHLGVNSIGALHLGTLEYNLITIPDYNSDPVGKYLSYIGVLDGQLCAIYYSTDYDYPEFDLWTMKEYGVKESWTKLSINCYNRRLKPLAYAKNEEVLVFNADGKIVAYEFKTRSFRILMDEEPWKPYIYVPYVPSLLIP